MRLSLFAFGSGHHQAAWRHPGASDPLTLEHYASIARTAERATFDAIFFADSQCVPPDPPASLSRNGQFVTRLDPLILLGALTAVTDRIGLICTASTSFNLPFQLARKFATLDHLSGGRVGWNIVTSGMAEEAQNFGLDEHLEHELRYERATEFVEVCMGLWDSWEDDAFPRNRESGVFLDPEKMQTLAHEGDHFKVKGPLNVPRMPQGYPLFVQAGASPTGQSFAARFAEMVFTGALTVEQAREQYDGLKSLASDHGRDPAHLSVMPGLTVLVGRTEEEALDERDRLASLVHVDVALHLVSKLVGVDVTGFPVDEPLPEPAPAGAAVYYDRFLDLTRSEGLTLGELGVRIGTQMAGCAAFGSAEQVADLMEEWFRSGVCDGFNLRPLYFPGALDRFVELVVPELRRRGLVRTEYEGRTLREHFGVPRPPRRARVV